MNWIDWSKVKIFYLFFLLIISCKDEYPILKEESRETFANLRFSNFRKIQYKGIGIKKWELQSEEAYVYQDKNQQNVKKIIVYNFTFEQFLPEKAFFKAKKAVLDQQENKMFLEGDAEFSDKEIQLKSDSLIYEVEKGILDTEHPVILKRKNTELKCLKGLYYDKKNDLQICRKPAGTIIQNNRTQNKDETNNFFF